MQAFEYMSVTEFAQHTGRHRSTVHKMIKVGILSEAGYRVQRVAPKSGIKTRRWSIGVPITDWCCADCGHEWKEDNKTPGECPSCGKTNVERRSKVA